MRTALSFALMLFGASLCFGADVYPSKPVRMVVPFAPGGGADLIARLISQPLAEQLGRPVIVDNRPGASGKIATELVAKSVPDGYTLLLAEPGFVTNPSLFKSLPYDAIKDFTPISHFLRDTNLLVVTPSINISTLKDFIALARANPGKYNYGASAVGSSNHLTAELFKAAAKLNVAHISYSGGGGEAITALLGGQIQMLFSTIPTLISHVKSGKLRALAVTTDGKRSLAMPEVPSFSEAGLPGMAVYAWTGLIGPARMPREVVNKLHVALVRTVALPSVNEKYIAMGGERELVASGPEDFSLYLRNELQRWAEVVKSAGITVQQ